MGQLSLGTTATEAHMLQQKEHDEKPTHSNEESFDDPLRTVLGPWGFPCDSAGKKIGLQCRRPGLDPWVGKIPWRRERLTTPVFWPGEFHGLYSLSGHKESDMAEQLPRHFTSLEVREP